MTAAQDIPGACPVCGGVTIAPATQRSTLLAVCDVLVMKALERLGNAIVRGGGVSRAERPIRTRQFGLRPLHTAHTIWAPPEDVVERILRGAWDVVPPLLDVHGCCDITAVQVVAMLDEYVRDLAITGTAHDLAELQYRFESRLGLPVYDRTPSLVEA